jgi:hypothetical protein
MLDGDLTSNTKVVVLTTPDELVPVIVTTKPNVGVAKELAVRTTDEEQVGLQLGALKAEAVTYVGRAEMLKLTGSVFPATRVAVRVSVLPAVAPMTTVSGVGEVLRE